MDKKINLLIFFLIFVTSFIYYYTRHNISISRHTRQDMKENNVSVNLTDKVAIPKKETYKTSDTSREKHPIKVHLTKANEDKRFIEENNISSVPIEEQEKHIAQVYSSLEPATYQEDIQEAEENFYELDIKSQEITQNLQDEMRDIEQ